MNYDPDIDDSLLYKAAVADTLDELADDAHANSRAHGFWDDHDGHPHVSQIPTKLMLIVTEVAEAMEVVRDAPTAVEDEHDYIRKTWYREADGKPEGFGSELADIIIRVLDLAAAYKVDIGGVLVEKMAFNSGRPHKHGKAL